jgi:hypothetical protein
MKTPSLVAGILAAALMTTAAVRAEIIDRILAVVDGQIITLSDVGAALRFELVPPEVSDDPIDATLQRLIDRQLMLVDVDRYAPPDPSPEAVEAGLAAIRARYADAATFEAALQQTAMSAEELRRFVRDSLRIEAYLQQRFASLVQPSESDAMAYYREHAAEFTVGGVLRPFEEVREEARARATAAQRAAYVREWVDGLRRRASLVILYLPPARGDGAQGTATRM